MDFDIFYFESRYCKYTLRINDLTFRKQIWSSRFSKQSYIENIKEMIDQYVLKSCNITIN